MKKKEKVVFILGPTGVGKTKMGVELAKIFNGEIISADSVQVFKGFDIGSAKVTPEEMQGVKHHCIDICQPEDYFTVADFVELTRQKICEINARGHLPIIVGGTGLYVKALLGGYDFGQTSKNTDFREEVNKLIDAKGSEVVWQELNALAPQLCEKISPNDRKRIVRAYEIYKFGGQPNSKGANYDFLCYALDLDRQKLYERLNLRVEIMLENGLIEEVKRLLSSGISEECQPMKAIGYKEVIPFVKGEMGYNEMVELIKSGAPNIVCIQPFACLPNHVVGKGVIKLLRKNYPESNVVAVDYDPGASEVNQLNRIKLMLTVAKKNLERKEMGEIITAEIKDEEIAEV